jgi:hypothetical protein
MAVTMVRNTPDYRKSNTTPGVGPVQWYETQYKLPGPQEWIFLPDAFQVKVVLSFPAGGAAFIEGTSSPPEILLGESGATDQTGGASPIVYPLTDTVTDVTPLLVNGETAIRVNVLGGTRVAISVRC